MARRLAAVLARVGACTEVLEIGRVGLGAGYLLRTPDLRKRLGASFKSRVEREYGEKRIAAAITEVYRRALSA